MSALAHADTLIAMEAGTVRGLRAGPLAPVWRVLGDEQLARAAGDGNDNAFAALYARYRPALRRYCASILLDPADAEDAVQATMLKAMRALPERDGRGPLRPWLYRIAHNESIDMLRRRRAQVGPAALETCFVPGPEADVTQRERLAELVGDLRALPERQGAALLMRELSGLSYSEVAEALSISPAAARQAVFEARSALHEFAAGRDTACASIQRSLSDGDRRRWRSRTVRAHLRACDQCRSFEHGIARRGDDLALLPPFILQGTATVALGGGFLSGMTGLAGGGAASGVGTLAGIAGGTAAKTLAGAAAGVVLGGAALGGGLVASGARHESPKAHGAAAPATALAAPTPIAHTPAPDSTTAHVPVAVDHLTRRAAAAIHVSHTVRRLPLAARRVAHMPVARVVQNAASQARQVAAQVQSSRDAAAQAMRDAMRQAAQQAAQRWAAQSRSQWEQAAQQYANRWSASHQSQPSSGTTAQQQPSQSGQATTGATTQRTPGTQQQWSGSWQAAWQEYQQRRAGGDASSTPTTP
jgi:RNA polymerase sigma factor (sigma-70 family)